jgi:hypothetical protein
MQHFPPYGQQSLTQIIVDPSQLPEVIQEDALVEEIGIFAQEF